VASNAFTNTYSRVWFIEGGAGPSRRRDYFGNWKAGAVSWDLGDMTVIREPDPNAYNKFIRVGRYRGEPGDPELPITARYTFQRSRLLKAARLDCEHTIQVHMGQCENPQDFPRGWEKTLILEGASINSYGTEDLGAMSPDENAPVNEEVPFVGTDLYEVVRMTFAEMAPDLVTGPVTSVYVCDSAQCGACGVATDGCQVVLAVMGGVAGSPGGGSTVLYTVNGGGTWQTVAGPPAVADKIYCAGDVAVALSDADDSMFYTSLTELVAGTTNWTRVATGYVTGSGPLAASPLGASETWIAGSGGVVYVSRDPALGVEVSSSGATTNDLHAIHALDSLNIAAVGAANTVLYTNNGGVTWASLVGPAPGVVLTSVWLRTALEMFVGTADGHLFYTINGGATWVEKGFAGSGSGSVASIVFTTPSVGYMAHNAPAGGAGRVMRTIDGGYSWYVMPEGAGTIPANGGVNTLAVCNDPNILFGGGDATGGDGILLKAA
jgi:photosystem II stability/assembly factor-like uncharacterized protein